jgi:predicted AAA+ superfamily ATPase
MFRSALHYLEKYWIKKNDRKPLIIRGARQVGKTWLARELAKNTTRQLLEINFERDPQLKSLFESNNPKIVLENLEIYLGKKIDLTSSILFLDEIQDAPEIIAKLRWFYEEVPELPVIVAGSLLEFIISDHAFSMPVGRITYMHLEPLSFEEFLCACGKETLLMYIKDIIPPFIIPSAIHQSLTDLFRRYIFVGGMPAAVASWVKDQSMDSVINIQQDLLSTYRDDFFKYKGRFDVNKLDKLLKAIPLQLGKKFVYSKADESIQSPSAKQILSLFNKARLSYSVEGCSGNGVPLAGEAQTKFSKQIFLDVGLANRFLGNNFSSLSTIIEGGISEQVVGQMLRCLFSFYVEPKLYYWQREEKGSSAEIDYLIEHEKLVVPIEVKSGSTGSLKSLHLFMNLKNLPIALRINNDLPSITPVRIKNADKTEVSYTLLSIPFYLTGQIHRLLGVNQQTT